MGKSEHLFLEELLEQVRFLSELGAEFIFLSQSKKKSLLENKAAPHLESSRSNDRRSELEEFLSLEKRILECERCHLFRTRTQAVPGEGNREAQLMFVGEAPGQDEDLQGRPFVGRAGQLLTRIIEAMTFKREEVYITNVVKCRPPQNRTPTHDEVQKCCSYLLEQIRLIQPRVIVALGKVATDFFIPNRASMSELRGKFAEYERIKIMPTFHPSFLIRNEGNKALKKIVWDDMQKVMALLGKK